MDKMDLAIDQETDKRDRLDRGQATEIRRLEGTVEVRADSLLDQVRALQEQRVSTFQAPTALPASGDRVSELPDREGSADSDRQAIDADWSDVSERDASS